MADHTYPLLAAMAPVVPANAVLFGCRAIAAHMGIGHRQVYRLIGQGELPAAKVGGRLFISVETLDAWIARSPATRSALPDPIGDFLAAFVVRDASGKVQARTLYLAYRDFVGRRGPTFLSEVMFAREMARRVGPSSRAQVEGHNCRAYASIRLRPLPIKAVDRDLM